MLNLYVGNLPYQITDQELNDLFSEIGEVQSARVMNDRETGRSRGFGFVEMASDEETQQAISAVNESEVEGRALVANEARERLATEHLADAPGASPDTETGFLGLRDNVLHRLFELGC